MWGNSNKFKAAKLDTIIGPNTEIRGDVNFSGCLHVDGKVVGNVSADDDSESMLTLNQGGCIEGDVQVPNLLLNGEVVGDVYACNRVELANSAKIKGNVYYHLLEMAMGAAINGNLVHRPKSEIRLLEHKSKKAPADAAQEAGKTTDKSD